MTGGAAKRVETRLPLGTTALPHPATYATSPSDCPFLAAINLVHTNVARLEHCCF